MLISDIKLIESPVIVVINEKEIEYENGNAAAISIPSASRLRVKSLSVRNNKIVLTMEEWDLEAPINYIGEMAI